MRHTEYGLEWELDPDEKKGQLGLLRENHYRPLFAAQDSFRPGDVWLDIGANIGAFAIRAAARGVENVVAVEPIKDLVTQLHQNILLNNLENVEVVQAAVTAESVDSVTMSLSNSFSSTHRVGKIRGRKNVVVPAIDANHMVKEWKVNKIKMDCEGSEAEILPELLGGSSIDWIEEIVFEYHFSFIKERPWGLYFEILRALESEEFSILRGTRERSKTWHTIVWAKRL